MCKKLVKPLLILLVVATGAAAQEGARVKPRNLAELQQRADLILHGHVVSAVVQPDPTYAALRTVVVTLRVEDTLKGSAGRSYTFRQFIWSPVDIADAAGYRKGQEVLLLLHAPNQNGLSSTVGLGQGRFRIVRDAKGNATALNAYSNAALFQGMATPEARSRQLSPAAQKAVSAPAGGPIDLSVLKEIIRSYGAAQ